MCAIGGKLATYAWHIMRGDETPNRDGEALFRRKMARFYAEIGKKRMGELGYGSRRDFTDFWVKERMVPEGITLGDIIVVENAGAYGYAMSYQYNGRLKPAEVLVNGDRHWLIRQRETIEDLVRNVTVPDHLK